MKVVHVNTYDSGGAFIAAYRIHSQMLKRGIDSKFLVLKRYEQTNVIEYLSLPRNVIAKIFESIKYRLIRILYCLIDIALPKKNAYISLPFTPYDISSLDLIRNADIVNLHFIAKFVSINSLSKIKRPIIWTLHDESPYSGIYHYSYDSSASKFDTVIKKYKQKRLANVRFICPSSWINNQLLESFDLLEPKSIVIHNGVSTIIKEDNSNSHKTTLKIGFVSGDLSDLRKGTDLFLKISDMLAGVNDSYELLVVGDNNTSNINRSTNIKYLGFLKNAQLTDFYMGLDLLLFTSRLDNLPNVLLESMAHKTPAVCFNIGGVNNIVTNGISGYLIPPFDEKLFLEKIEFLLENPQQLKKMGANAFRSICQTFEISSQTSKYLTHYQDIIT